MCLQVKLDAALAQVEALKEELENLHWLKEEDLAKARREIGQKWRNSIVVGLIGCNKPWIVSVVVELKDLQGHFKANYLLAGEVIPLPRVQADNIFCSYAFVLLLLFMLDSMAVVMMRG